MSHVHSFDPLAQPDATRLILGSMPGKASLAAGQYYAHPRNAFWQVMAALLQWPADTPYALRCEALAANRIAVWDVLKTCTRGSSLDSDIDPASIVVNDFAAFFARHPCITHVYFNGGTAERIWRRHVFPALPEDLQQLQTWRLPSTSPAHAALGLAEKLRQWSVLKS
jgi:TDG/mug DNA glycosylase family protein